MNPPRWRYSIALQDNIKYKPIEVLVNFNTFCPILKENPQ